jgi:DNA mismatch endonuclease (patch repair protein)
MVDVVDRATRSRMMSGIKGRDTKPERIVRKYLHKRGLRFRLAPKHLPGKPDIVLPKHRTVIFVHGCFWHRHEGCKYAANPKTNSDFWQKKLSENVKRDRRNSEKLEQSGWQVLTIWECQANEKKLHDLANRVMNFG